jgi:preprotein translocase subunit SecF
MKTIRKTVFFMLLIGLIIGVISSFYFANIVAGAMCLLFLMILIRAENRRGKKNI